MSDIIPQEHQIMRATIHALLAAGFPISVNDGEEVTLRESRDAEAIFAAMRTTDEDYLIVHRPDGSTAWVRFIYGNDGWDVINDYTVSLESVLAPVNALADKLSG